MSGYVQIDTRDTLKKNLCFDLRIYYFVLSMQIFPHYHYQCDKQRQKLELKVFVTDNEESIETMKTVSELTNTQQFPPR